MQARGLSQVERLSDDELEATLCQLVANGQRTDALVVMHLAELDARKIHLKEGAESLFHYCISKLGLSEMEAFYRISAARLGRQFPVIFELLTNRRIHLTAIHLLRPHLTPENHAELLAEACGKSKRQLESCLARRFPRADAAERLRKLNGFEALSEDRYLLQVTVSCQLKEKLELARDLASHSNRDGMAGVLDAAVDLLLGRLKARRFGIKRDRSSRRGQRDERQVGVGSPATESAAAHSKFSQPGPRSRQQRQTADHSGQNTPASRSDDASELESEDRLVGERAREHIPNRVRREVTERDDLRCSFVGRHGTRCGARAFLQFDHEQAWARRGTNEPGNLRLLCAAHNRLLAEAELGEAHVQKAIAEKRKLCRNE